LWKRRSPPTSMMFFFALFLFTLNFFRTSPLALAFIYTINYLLLFVELNIFTFYLIQFLMKKLTENNEEINKINAEILSHMSNPRNYGEMLNSDGIGKCLIEKSTEFLMVYISVNNDNILEDITYGCKANQDSSLTASIFTEMVKGDSLDNALESLQLMESQILNVPKSQKMNSSMVLHAFRAAMINRENKLNGMTEDIFIIPLVSE
jgi:nitrogen fixation NifU-like protein